MIAEITTFLLMAAPAAADDGGIPGWIPRLFNLALFLGFLYYLLRKPAAAFFESRSAAITAALEQAQRDKAEADQKLAEVNERLASLDAERDRIREEARAESEAEQARIEERAREEAAKIAETAEREIEGALKSARANLQQFVAEKSVELAEATIRAEMNETDRHRIVEEYTEQLGGMKQ